MAIELFSLLSDDEGWIELPVDQTAPAYLWAEGGLLADDPVDMEKTFEGNMWFSTKVDGSFNLNGLRCAPDFSAPRHHHNLDELIIMFALAVEGGHRLAERGAVGGLASTAPGRQPDRAHDDTFEIHTSVPPRDAELHGHPGLGGEGLQMRKRGLLQPVPLDGESPKLEQPHTDPIAARITLKPPDLTQLVSQPMQSLAVYVRQGSRASRRGGVEVDGAEGDFVRGPPARSPVYT